MLRFGLRPVLAILILGIALPWALYRLSRAVGVLPTIVGAVAVGIAYGAIKADHAWAGDGLSTNLGLVALSAAVAGCYAAAVVAAARAIAKRL